MNIVSIEINPKWLAYAQVTEKYDEARRLLFENKNGNFF